MLEEQRLKQEKKMQENAEKEKVKLWDKQVKDFTGLVAHLEEAKQIQNLRKKQLDDLHKEKILISDAIYVVNKDGYIGDITKSDIEYAKSPSS